MHPLYLTIWTLSMRQCVQPQLWREITVVTLVVPINPSGDTWLNLIASDYCTSTHWNTHPKYSQIAPLSDPTPRKEAMLTRGRPRQPRVHATMPQWPPNWQKPNGWGLGERVKDFSIPPSMIWPSIQMCDNVCKYKCILQTLPAKKDKKKG